MRIELAPPARNTVELRGFVAEAERHGWTGAWVSELAGIDGVAAAALAACSLTSGRVGSAILPMQTRDPLLLAMAASTLSQAAPGGFVLGLGTSTKVIIEDWHATAWGPAPIALTRECVGLVRRFLAGERVTTDSGRWRYNRSSLTFAAAGPVPILLAALNDRMLELAGEIADGVILNFVTPGDVRHAMARLRAGAERAGRSLDGFEIVVYFRATATADFEPVRERYQRELFTYAMAPLYRQMFDREDQGAPCLEVESLWKDGKREEALAAIPEPLMRDRTLVGTPAAINARLAEYEEAGAQTAIVFPVATPGRDYMTECNDMLEALAPIRAESARGAT